VKILLFGGNGQLGSAVRAHARDLQFDVISPVAKEVDVREANSVAFIMAAVQPDVVINCAGYTAVDRAEQESELAFSVNSQGAANVAVACKASGARLIHISTDYVFDGTLDRALCEDDAPNPLNVYGRSKLAGERAVRDILGESALIVRTQALFGERGRSFISTFLDLCYEREVLALVSDQVVSPTYVGWMAEVLLDFVRIPVGGTIHATARGGVSWFEVGQELLRGLGRLSPGGRSLPRLEPVTAASLRRPAVRPLFLTLDTRRLESVLKRASPDWKEGLSQYLAARFRSVSAS
jgi:dTDP-4-dehydrorhamnose reductase